MTVIPGDLGAVATYLLVVIAGGVVLVVGRAWPYITDTRTCGCDSERCPYQGVPIPRNRIVAVGTLAGARHLPYPCGNEIIVLFVVGLVAPGLLFAPPGRFIAFGVGAGLFVVETHLQLTRWRRHTDAMEAGDA